MADPDAGSNEPGSPPAPAPASRGKPAKPARTVRGSRIVVPLLIVLLAAALVVGLYKSQEQEGPPLRFERLPPASPDAANATSLPAKEVHDAFFLEDHLRTAQERGNSTETVLLRIDAMKDALRRLTGHDAPWLVAWNGAAFRVSLDAA